MVEAGLAVAGLQAVAARSARALGRAAAAYQPPADGADTAFGELLASHAGGEDDGGDDDAPAADTAAARRLAALAGADGDGDVVAAAGGLAPNERCPLSGKPVRGGEEREGDTGRRRAGALVRPPSRPQLLQIDDPVVDRMGYVYEKASILGHIAAQGGRARRVRAPVAGTAHAVVADDLRPAAAVVRAKKAAARGGGRRASGVGADLLA